MRPFANAKPSVTPCREHYLPAILALPLLYLDRFRPTHTIALHPVHSQCCEGIPLLLRLHGFRDDLDIEAMCNLDHGFYKELVALVALDTAYIAAITLQIINFQRT